jgi:hypothetical protein
LNGHCFIPDPIGARTGGCKIIVLHEFIGGYEAAVSVLEFLHFASKNERSFSGLITSCLVERKTVMTIGVKQRD